MRKLFKILGVSAAVVLAVAVLFLFLTRSEPERPSHKTPNYAALRTFKIEKAAIDAHNAIKVSDFRLMAKNGYTTYIPGSDDGDFSLLESEYGIRVIRGTSDVWFGSEGEAFERDATLYAQNYNQVILNTVTTIAAGLQAKAIDGDAEAQERLGRIYKNGWGVKQDYAEAAKWFNNAAKNGNIEAMNYLGMMYGNGWGVKQDQTEAYFWYRLNNKAAHILDLNSTFANHRDRVAQHVTPEKKAEVDKRVQEWMETHPAPASDLKSP